MDKDKYIKQGLLSLTSSSIEALLPYGALFLALLSIMDFFVTPDNFTKFLIYRLIASLSVLLLFIFFKLNKNKTDQFLVFTIILATIIPSAMVEGMIFSFGGHQSTYYAGMIVVIIFILGFLIIPFNVCVVVAGLIYATYLIPLLLFDSITNIGIFINNNMFLTASAFGALGWRYFNLKLIKKNLSLEYDLTQEKEQLKIYSTQLEQLVAERTKELGISEKRYRELFDSANDGIVVFNENGIIVDLNKQFCEMHGFDKASLIGANIKIFEPDNQTGEKDERMRMLLDGEAIVFETEHIRKDGSTVLLEVSSKAIDIDGKIYIQSFHRDIGEKKRLQNQLFHSQKMESIGVLAGGLAHDFNNMLTSLLGHTELLQLEENMDAMSRKRLQTIENSARKAGQMVSQLLGFARKGEFVAMPMILNDALNDAIELVGRIMKKKEIEILKEFSDDIPVIKGDSSQLEQVIVNLLMNAGDAMPDGGTITVTTSTIKIEKNDNRYPLLTPGTYASVKITDTGTGIPNEIINKIFDPFFTTKALGKGTGLGLAMVYGIIREHQGTIDVRSQMGKGTTFEVYLPAYVGHSSV